MGAPTLPPLLLFRVSLTLRTCGWLASNVLVLQLPLHSMPHAATSAAAIPPPPLRLLLLCCQSRKQHGSLCRCRPIRCNQCPYRQPSALSRSTLVAIRWTLNLYFVAPEDPELPTHLRHTTSLHRDVDVVYHSSCAWVPNPTEQSKQRDLLRAPARQLLPREEQQYRRGQDHRPWRVLQRLPA